MYQWEAQVRRDENPPNEAGLSAVRAEFEQTRQANRSAMWAIYGLFGVIVFITVVFPYIQFGDGLMGSGLPDAIVGIVLAGFNLMAPWLLNEATKTIDNERIYTLYGRYFSPEAMAAMRSEIAVSVDTYRLVIALITAAGLLGLALRRFVA